MKWSIGILAVTVAACLLPGPAMANLVNVYTSSDPVQDDWTISGEWDEMGTAPAFVAPELLSSYYVGTESYDPCPSEKQQGVNVLIEITNLSAFSYRDVYYVADPETDLTNYDEWVGNAGLGDARKAFRIDFVGANQPLISESVTVNGIWEPNETWGVVIQDYTNTLGVGPEKFGSLGITSASAGDLVSSGSILVPEPASLSLLVLGGLAMLRRRRR
jgi:hypothetical protein